MAEALPDTAGVRVFITVTPRGDCRVTVRVYLTPPLPDPPTLPLLPPQRVSS